MEDDTRDRVRALVREVLAKAAPETADDKPQSRFVNTVPESSTQSGVTRDESAKSVITEDDVRGLEAGAVLRIGEDARLTPLAQDIVNDLQITLVRKEPRNATVKVRSVALGADHGGYKMKEQLKGFLSDFGINVRDFGTNSEDAVDYPDFAHAVAQSVSGKQVDVGIIVDGAGIGSAMTANKVPNVRAAACYSTALAKNSREHNGANILTLGAGQNSFDEVKQIVEAFISTDISEDRHKKRVGKIDNIDRQYRR